MKLAFSAWAMREAPVDRQVAVVRDAGYLGICLVSGAGQGLDALAADAAERRRIRGLLDSADLAPTALAGHADLIEADPERRAQNWARVRANVELAADLGAPCLVLMGYGKPERYETDRQRQADAFGELARFAGPRGVTVALEAHVGQAMDRPDRVRWLLDAVGSPHFRLNLDNSHFEVMGYDLDEYLPALIPDAVHTDLKDQRGRYPDHQFLVPGEGNFDYARYLRAMADAGYGGFITVEISVMAQRRPGYDPADAAARSFATLTDAAARAGVALVHR